MEKHITGFEASNFKDTAIQQWELRHQEEALTEDPIVLQKLLKEAQIRQIELELEREELFQV